MRRSRFLLGLGSLLVAAAMAATDARAAEATWPASIGSTRLELPIPDGYSEAGTVSPELRQIVEKFVPPGNRLLAAFVSRSDVAALRANPALGLKRYLVQTLRQTEQKELSKSEFAQARTIIREQYRSMLATAATTAQKQFDSNVRDLRAKSGGDLVGLKLGEVRGLEVFHDEADAVSALIVTKVGVQTSTGTVESPLAAAMNTAIVRKKLIYFYAYTNYAGPTDLEWAKAASKAWLKSVARLNP